MYFGMRRSGWRTPVPSHKSFCFRTGDPGFTSGVDGWAPSWGFFWSSAFGLVCAAAGDWSFELLPGGGVWLNAVDAKNQRKKAQRRVIDLLLSPNGEHAVGRSPETQAGTCDIRPATNSALTKALAYRGWGIPARSRRHSFPARCRRILRVSVN